MKTTQYAISKMLNNELEIKNLVACNLRIELKEIRKKMKKKRGCIVIRLYLVELETDEPLFDCGEYVVPLDGSVTIMEKNGLFPMDLEMKI